MKLKILSGCLLILGIWSGYSSAAFGQQKEHQEHKSLMNKNEKMNMDHSGIKDKEAREYIEDLHKEALSNKGEYTGIWNKVCPVLGYKVDKRIKPVKYNGVDYGFCCKDCPRKFEAEPEKYIRKLSKDGKKFIGKK